LPKRVQVVWRRGQVSLRHGRVRWKAREVTFKILQKAASVIGFAADGFDVEPLVWAAKQTKTQKSEIAERQNSMARKKRKSDAVSTSETRAQALGNIDPKLDLGKGLTLKDYSDKVGETRDALNEYNALLADSDVALVKLNKLERELRDLSERMLEGVSSRFGKNSDEYQKAGGTRKDQIVRNSAKAKAAKLNKAA